MVAPSGMPEETGDIARHFSFFPPYSRGKGRGEATTKKRLKGRAGKGKPRGVSLKGEMRAGLLLKTGKHGMLFRCFSAYGPPRDDGMGSTPAIQKD